MSNRSGFTLAEVLVATCLLSVAVLGVARCLSLAERFAGRTRAGVRAAFDLQDAMVHAAVPESLCSATTGVRQNPRVSLSWSTGPLPATRLFTVVSRPAFPGARPESAGVLVGCP